MIGKVLFEYDNLSSTNELALELAAQGDISEGAVVQTHHQTRGRGQMGTTWFSQPNMNITLSVILKPTFLELQHQFYLNKAIVLAVADTVSHFVDSPVAIKWPNDVYIDNQKTAGILIQNSVQHQKLAYSIVGIGLNVNQMEFDSNLPNPTSLRLKAGKQISIEKVRSQLFLSLNQTYASIKIDLHAVDENFKRLLYAHNQQRQFVVRDGSTFKGMIVDVAKDGRLMVQLENGEINRFALKEIAFQ